MVVDASVFVSNIVPHDVHHVVSRAWLIRHVSDGGLVIAPALVLSEIAGAVGRRTGMPRLARRAVEALLLLPAFRLITIDAPLARTAAELAGRLRLRGADAVYIATATTLGMPLVTWDAEQRQRAATVIHVVSPEAGR
jgi:predicted nucleic acid-binding protein